MARAKPNRLDRAKQLLTIAESGDAKREAYKAAANEIAAHKAETGETNRNVATFLGVSVDRVQKLLQWRKTGFAAQTPYLMDETATDRAAFSHGRKILRNEPKRLAKEMAEALADPDVRAAVSEHLPADSPAATTLAPRPRPERVDPLGHLSPAERKAREAAGDTLVKPIMDGIGGFATLSIVGHIEQATEDLRDMDSISSADAGQIERAIGLLQRELVVKQAMRGV